MKSLVRLVIGGGVVGGLCLGIGQISPTEVSVARSIEIDASSAEIFPFLASFQHGWSSWDPFRDDEQNVAFSGPASGQGASESFLADGALPARRTLTRASPSNGVSYRLEIEGDRKAQGEIRLSKLAKGTQVTWSERNQLDRGRLRWPWSTWWLNFSVGRKHQEGLLALQRLAEARAHPVVSHAADAGTPIEAAPEVTPPTSSEAAAPTPPSAASPEPEPVQDQPEAPVSPDAAAGQ